MNITEFLDHLRQHAGEFWHIDQHEIRRSHDGLCPLAAVYEAITGKPGSCLAAHRQGLEIGLKGLDIDLILSAADRDRADPESNWLRTEILKALDFTPLKA